MTHLVEVQGVKKYFPVTRSFFRRERRIAKAVDDISLVIREGESLGLAGESGSGKTTLGRLIGGLLRPTSGVVKLMGVDISRLSEKEMRDLRRNVQFVFQDPFGSFNPRKTVWQILSKPFSIYGNAERDVESEVPRLLEAVGLTPASSFMERYPHELSGGQRQRVGIARAIAIRPKLVIADEPVSSLDVSVRAQILELMRNLEKEFKLTYLFISHDLAVLRSVCKKITIMYLGKIVEQGKVEDVFSNPVHPYTRILLASTPLPDPHKVEWRRISLLEGDPPSPINPPSGCRFHQRCPIMEPSCMTEEPQLTKIRPEHYAACPVMLRRIIEGMTSVDANR